MNAVCVCVCVCSDRYGIGEMELLIRVMCFGVPSDDIFKTPEVFPILCLMHQVFRQKYCLALMLLIHIM